MCGSDSANAQPVFHSAMLRSHSDVRCPLRRHAPLLVPPQSPSVYPEKMPPITSNFP
jgi:hypothetical protein